VKKNSCVNFVVIFAQIIMFFQMYLIIKNKSAWDVSYTGYVIAFIFAFCNLLYRLLKKEKQLIAVSVLLSFNSFLVAAAIFIYR